MSSYSRFKEPAPDVQTRFLLNQTPEKPRFVGRHKWRKTNARCAGCSLLCSGAGFFALVRCFELHILVHDPGNVFLGHFHVPHAFGPNHHVGAKRANIEAAAPDHANLALEVTLLGYFTQLLDNLFGAAVPQDGLSPLRLLMQT